MECDKPISNKAISCPFCGFPLREYLYEMQADKIRAEEQKRLEEEEQLRVQNDKEENERRENLYSSLMIRLM